MKGGWEPAPLKQLLEVQNGFAFDSKKFNAETGIPLIRIRDLKGGETTEAKYSGPFDRDYLVHAGDLLIGMDGEFGCYEWKGEPALLNQRVCRLRNFSDTLLPRFLYYGINKYLKEIEDATAFTTVKHLSSKSVLSIEFPHPPLPEQQRIVTKLDAAFAALAEAQAHVERNRANARELFESYLNGVFEGGEGWEEKSIEECFRIRSGDFLPAKSMVQDGAFDVYGGNGIAGKHDRFNLEGSNVIIGRVGAKCGNVRHVTTPIWLTDNAFYISEFKIEFDHDFLTAMLNHLDLRSFARQAAQPVVSYSSLKDVALWYPASVEEQRIISGKFRELDVEVQKLETTYQKKLMELAGLKKGLLAAAFGGRL